MEELFNSMKPFFAAWLRLYKKDTYHSFKHFAVLPCERLPEAPLYYATLCGFYDFAEHLTVNHPEQVNAIGGYYVSPLEAALVAEHLKIAPLLYQHGANMDLRGYGKRTLLCVASNRHCEVVEWLLIAAQIQISGAALAGLRSIVQQCLDAPKSPRSYSSTRRLLMPKMTMARFHYTSPRNGGTSISLDYCSNRGADVNSPRTWTAARYCILHMM